jgi:hypothetical protein
MLYNTITTYTEAREFNGRVHRATARFTVGYTVVNGVTNIYAMVHTVILRWNHIPDMHSYSEVCPLSK